MTTLDTGTVIQEQWTAVFYTAAKDVPDRSVDDYTIHWWGTNPDGSLMTNFDAVIATFCNGNKQTSAHFIVEAGRVACVVSPDDVAWACGNWYGNVHSISIECNPRGSDGDYAEVASLIRYLRTIYGDKPLVPHNKWTATECPGTYDLNRLTNLANGIPDPVPAPAPKDGKVFLAKLDNDNSVYISDGVTYRWVQDPATLQWLTDNGVADAGIKTVPSLTVLGVNADILKTKIARSNSALGGDTSPEAVVSWFDANMEGLQNLIKAITTVTPQIDYDRLAEVVVAHIKSQWSK